MDATYLKAVARNWRGCWKGMGRMRHTRNRQLGKLQGYKLWKNSMNFPIKDMDQNELDKTFKWHREYNNVSYGNGDNQVFIDIYRDSVYW